MTLDNFIIYKNIHFIINKNKLYHFFLEIPNRNLLLTSCTLMDDLVETFKWNTQLSFDTFC